MKHDILAPWAEPVPDAHHPMTASDLLALDKGSWHYELVEGRLVRMPPTGLEHFYVTDSLHSALRAHVTSNQLGLVTLPDTGFLLSRPGNPDTVLSPDIAFISAERARQLPARGTSESRRYLAVTPDLAVETASPDQYHPEMARKAALYLEAGTRLLWVIWPQQCEVDNWRAVGDTPAKTLRPGDILDGEDVVPGFSYEVSKLFG